MQYTVRILSHTCNVMSCCVYIYIYSYVHSYNIWLTYVHVCNYIIYMCNIFIAADNRAMDKGVQILYIRFYQWCNGSLVSILCSHIVE